MSAMPDEPTTASSISCPWCSTVSPAGTATCPSCGAALVASGDGTVPGVTSVDPEAVLRAKGGKSRGGILGFLSGETGDTVDMPTAEELQSTAPPNADVQIEMMRLELEARRQRIEAEAGELQGEYVIEEAEERGGTAGTTTAAAPAAVAAAATAAAPASTAPTAPPPGPEEAEAASEEPPPGP
jgi:hypothetical protein